MNSSCWEGADFVTLTYHKWKVFKNRKHGGWWTVNPLDQWKYFKEWSEAIEHVAQFDKRYIGLS
jgi:hypothetical protein